MILNLNILSLDIWNSDNSLPDNSRYTVTGYTGGTTGGMIGGICDKKTAYSIMELTGFRGVNYFFKSLNKFKALIYL
jgi:hypothetical protein